MQNVQVYTVQLKDETNESTYCAGSYAKAVRKGSKNVNGRLRYKCPECGKHYTADAAGQITKHGYKLGTLKTNTVTCFCAQCKKKFESAEGWDYLCEKCRAK